MHIYINTCIHKYIQTDRQNRQAESVRYTHRYIYIDTYVRTYAGTYIHTYTHKYLVLLFSLMLVPTTQLGHLWVLSLRKATSSREVVQQSMISVCFVRVYWIWNMSIFSVRCKNIFKNLLWKIFSGSYLFHQVAGNSDFML